MIISTKGPQNVGQIQKQFRAGNLFLSPEEYQRENAWGLPQKQLLIDTIFREMDIPKFYLWKIDQRTLAEGYPDGGMKDYYKQILEDKRTKQDEVDPYIFEVVDGQQRIRTLLEFTGLNPPNNKCYRGVWLDPFQALQETPKARGKSWDKLTVEQQIAFEEHPLTVMVLQDTTISEIRDMFLRLQNGTPLNAQQKRDAMGSAIGRAAREIAQLLFFKQSVAFDNVNGTHHLVASHMVNLELKEKISSCTSPQLDKIYKDYKNIPLDSDAILRVKKIVGIMGKIFPQRHQHLNQNYALSLYWLLSRILLTYEISEDQYTKIHNNFERLDVARLEALSRDYNGNNDKIFEDLSLAMSRGNLGTDGISTRHDIIGQYLFQDVLLREHPNLDPLRIFSGEEKLLLYHRSQGRCQLDYAGAICGRDIPFDDSVVDHMLPHSKGGKTTLSNGRIAFKLCNIARGNRSDFNPQMSCALICHDSND